MSLRNFQVVRSNTLLTRDKEQISRMFTSEMIEQNAKVVIVAARDSSPNDRTRSGRECRRQ
jgi:hypothetical protein